MLKCICFGLVSSNYLEKKRSPGNKASEVWTVDSVSLNLFVREILVVCFWKATVKFDYFTPRPTSTPPPPPPPPSPPTRFTPRENFGLQWGKLAKSTLSLFRHSDRFDFVFSLRCTDWVRKPLCEPNVLCILYIRIISGHRVKFVQWKAFKPAGSVYH